MNWLHNGQGDGDTETGAHTLTVQGIQDDAVAREPGAAFAVTSENEWYKAAYFHGAGYYDDPAGSDAVIDCAAPTAAPNRANCNSAAGGVADVGSYPGSPSPWGTFDQGGSFFEWTEAAEGAARSLRGGGWGSADFALAASYWEQAQATTEFGIRIGFRPVRLVPEPTGAAWASVSGLAVLAAGRRRRARAEPRRGGRQEQAVAVRRRAGRAGAQRPFRRPRKPHEPRRGRRQRTVALRRRPSPRSLRRRIIRPKSAATSAPPWPPPPRYPR